MKILIFEDSDVLGGTKRSLGAFATAAAEVGEITTLTPSSPFTEGRDDIRMVRLRLPAKPSRPLGRLVLTAYEILAVAGAFFRESPDCIITLNLRGHLASGLVAFLTKAKVGWYVLDNTPKITRVGRLLPFFSRFIKGAVMPSEAQRRALEGYFHCPLVKIPHGIESPGTPVPSAQEKSELKQQQSLPADGIAVGMAARIAPDKGLEEFLEIAERLNDERFVFVVRGQAGDAGYLNDLNERIAASPSKTRVILKDRTTDRLALYGPLDISLLPFVRAEGFPRAVLESMAAGLPTVVSDVEPLREIITDGSDGFIVRPRDIGRFVEILRSLVDPALRHRVGTEARRSVLTRFPIEKYQARVRAFLEAFLNNPAAITNTHK